MSSGSRRTLAHHIAAGLASALVVLGFNGAPAALAHGPVAPSASAYLARITSAPPGVQAKVVDGDQRMWLKVGPQDTLVVLDPRGAPYLRFSRGHVEVNRNSTLYYLNQTPVQTPPPGLRASAPPAWSVVGQDSSYSWHDGRLHALAVTALTPGSSYVGPWRIPVLVDGRPTAIAGGLWHADAPSPVWFWPIVVILACTLAARRVRDARLHRRVLKLLGAGALLGILLAAVAGELYGRPTLSALQIIVFVAIIAFVAWAARLLLLGRLTYLTRFGVAAVAIWEGVKLVPTLLDGFVLSALTPFPTRLASVLCLGCAAGLLLIPSGLDAEPRPHSHDRDEGASGDRAARTRGSDRGLRLAP